MYECQIWVPTLREKYKFRAFQNRVLKGIIGPKREEVKGAS
jgi:hypothetical protein